MQTHTPYGTLTTASAETPFEYTDLDIVDFESRLERIYSREVHRVLVADFLGLPDLLRDGLT
ncbi:hypothetical protein Tco_0473270, partial [Tanacetum coccineum]